MKIIVVKGGFFACALDLDELPFSRHYDVHVDRGGKVFLSIGFLSIPNVVEATLDAHDRQPGDTLDAIYEVDHWAREKAESIVKGLAGK